MLNIIKPTLLLDRSKAQRNMNKMIAKAEKHHVRLVPHFKTHQSAQVGEWFKREGIGAITVTSLKMANYFANNGWEDITVAFPANVLEVKEINELSKRVRLTIFLNSSESAKILREQVVARTYFNIEIDAGYHRSGVGHDQLSEIKQIMEIASGSNLYFSGFYTHAGNSYDAASSNEIKDVHREVVQKLNALKANFKEVYPNLKISLGDTPSCSLADYFDGVDNIGPGNFIYYDLVQHRLGSNSIDEIAICLAVPVVSVHPERNEVVVHSGWVHQGKDSINDSEEAHYGLVVRLQEQGWSAPIPEAKVTKLSQEHGNLHLPEDMIRKIKVGDILGILPVHACATALMMGELYTLDGEKIEMMPGN